jgi:hypothetical protein
LVNQGNKAESIGNLPSQPSAPINPVLRNGASGHQVNAVHIDDTDEMLMDEILGTL